MNGTSHPLLLLNSAISFSMPQEVQVAFSQTTIVRAEMICSRRMLRQSEHHLRRLSLRLLSLPKADKGFSILQRRQIFIMALIIGPKRLINQGFARCRDQETRKSKAMVRVLHELENSADSPANSILGSAVRWRLVRRRHCSLPQLAPTRYCRDRKLRMQDLAESPIGKLP